jgi:hypothetical protein
LAERKPYGELEKIAIAEIEERVRRDHSSEAYGTKVIEAGFEEAGFIAIGVTFTRKRSSWIESPGLNWGIQLDPHTGEVVGIKFSRMKSELDQMVDSAEEARRQARGGNIARIPRPEDQTK